MRALIDLSTLLRWRGPAVGIPRCAQEYARHALHHVPQAQFTLFDTLGRCFRTLRHEHAAAILQGRLRADLFDQPEINPHRSRFADRVPGPLRPPYFWATKTRRKLLALLERHRLRSGAAAAARIEAVQARLIGRHASLFHGPDGARIPCPGFRDIAGPRVVLRAGDVVLAMQTDWVHTDIAAVLRATRAVGAHYVPLCQDILPIQRPDWFPPADAAGFEAHFRQAFPGAGRVMLTTEYTARQVRGWCAAQGMALADTAVVPMGCDIPARSDAPLPPGLSPGRFALFVSTMEPRKNHALLVEAWRRLGDTGDFRLVFVGRVLADRMGDLPARIAATPGIVQLSGVHDAALAALYRDAAFCLYPSRNEGFGLPVVEALGLGKPLLIADAGPLPEVSQGCATALDADDADAWAAAMARWMHDATAREAGAAAARCFRPVTWEQSAERFYAAALAPMA